jgi:succinate dehydrogenase/fumarate reductase cytochrome b subunit
MPDPIRSAAPHDREVRLLRAQSLSGVAFSLFLLLHLANQGVAALGADRYDQAQCALRRGYQSAPLELGLVLAPLLVHVTTAVMRLLDRRRRRVPTPVSRASRLHRLSGIVLLVFFAGHVAATRGASLIYGVYPGFAGVAFTLRWVPAYFWPYYLVFGVAGAYHLVYGLGVALPILGVSAGRVLRRPAILAPAAVALGLCVAVGLLGFGGAFFPVGHPEDSAYARLLVRLGVARAVTRPCRDCP